jgi:hypothetical protein
MSDQLQGGWTPEPVWTLWTKENSSPYRESPVTNNKDGANLQYCGSGWRNWSHWDIPLTFICNECEMYPQSPRCHKRFHLISPELLENLVVVTGPDWPFLNASIRCRLRLDLTVTIQQRSKWALVGSKLYKTSSFTAGQHPADTSINPRFHQTVDSDRDPGKPGSAESRIWCRPRRHSSHEALRSGTNNGSLTLPENCSIRFRGGEAPNCT